MDDAPPDDPRPLAIVIGASAGGVEALRVVAAGLPRDLHAAVCVVLHVGSHPSILPELLRSCCALPAMHARDGQRPDPGAIYVAPPDHHLLLERDRLRLHRGSKENHARPAVNPLFRSAALSWGPDCIGVVLTGQLEDGAAGLAAIASCGGVAIVQEPREAFEPGMPGAGLAAVPTALRLPLHAIGAKLVQLAAAARPAAVPPIRTSGDSLWELKRRAFGAAAPHGGRLARHRRPVAGRDRRNARAKSTSRRPASKRCSRGTGPRLG